MAAEIHGFGYGVDNAFVARSMTEEILGKKIPIDCYVHSKTLFDVIAKHANTKEKRLQIDVFAIRESHKKQEIRKLAWIPGKDNVADGMTKGIVSDNHPLYKLIKTNKLDITPQGWVDMPAQHDNNTL